MVYFGKFLGVTMLIKELEDYRKFTKPAELHKAVNTLKGIIAGITTDNVASEKEMIELMHWCTLHAHLRDRHPFNELLPLVEDAYADGVVTNEEAKDIVWLCNNFVSDNDYYDLVTSSVQFLSGLLHGIMADGVLDDREVHALSAWLNANRYLAGCYPFDEIDSLVSSTLADKKIDQEERERLMAYFSNFIDCTESYNLDDRNFADLKQRYSVDGICAICPEIAVEGSNFCFTGESRKYKRAEIIDLITSAGGRVYGSVSRHTNYVVVGGNGNPCWAYACYGRKIEEAVKLRKAGSRLLIIHENDLWDALEDL